MPSSDYELVELPGISFTKYNGALENVYSEIWMAVKKKVSDKLGWLSLQKYFSKSHINFWGEQEILTQPFKVIGINKETGEEITVFEYPTNNSLAPNNGADHHIPFMMMLPSAGIWKLEVYFGEELFGNVIVNVEEK